MDDDKLRNQIPIFRFLNKHKWRIVLPILIYAGYFYLPLYHVDRPAGGVFHLLVTSTQNVAPENLNQEVTKITEQVQSDESMVAMINKYGLFSKARRQGVPDNELIDKMRASMVVGPDVPSDPPGIGVSVFVWTNLPDEGPEKTKALSDEIISRFASRAEFNVVDAPKPPLPELRIPLSIRIFFQLVLLFPALITSFLLIFIWEIPFLFYSKKTQEMVFDPIRADWQCELTDPNVNTGILEGVQINIRYSFAFVGAMLAKSPIGEIFEFAGKWAR